MLIIFSGGFLIQAGSIKHESDFISIPLTWIVQDETDRTACLSISSSIKIFYVNSMVNFNHHIKAIF